MPDLSDEDILGQLGVEPEAPKPAGRNPRDERIVAGFEDIQRFVDEHGHPPHHGVEHDIFERLYAVRLDRLRSSDEYREMLQPVDRQGLLEGASNEPVPVDATDDELLAALGVDEAKSDITELRHVRPSAEKKAAEEVARRDRCPDFEKFKPLFEQVQQELKTGLRETRPFEMKAEIEQGRFFIVSGQVAYVAEKGETTLTDHGRTDARLRVIFDNGTESGMLMRSLQRALNADDAGRRITEATAGPLFADHAIDGDEPSGIIYVLRSKSDHPMIRENRELAHKIGVTNMDVEKRIAGAHLQATFLLSEVEIVATYELFNINRSKLENLLHRIFEPARLDIEIMDRFGNPVRPREWFLVPLFVIDDAVQKIKDGTITDYRYDPSKANLVLHSDEEEVFPKLALLVERLHPKVGSEKKVFPMQSKESADWFMEMIETCWGGRATLIDLRPPKENIDLFRERELNLLSPWVMVQVRKGTAEGFLHSEEKTARQQAVNCLELFPDATAEAVQFFFESKSVSGGDVKSYVTWYGSRFYDDYFVDGKPYGLKKLHE